MRSLSTDVRLGCAGRRSSTRDWPLGLPGCSFPRGTVRQPIRRDQHGAGVRRPLGSDDERGAAAGTAAPLPDQLPGGLDAGGAARTAQDDCNGHERASRAQVGNAGSLRKGCRQSGRRWQVQSHDKTPCLGFSNSDSSQSGVSAPRRVVVASIGSANSIATGGRPFATVRDLAAYLEKNEPAIDLSVTTQITPHPVRAGQ